MNLRLVKYSPDQPRDDQGRWTDGGSSGGQPKWEDAKAMVGEAGQGQPYGTRDPAVHAASTTTDHPRYFFHDSKTSNRESIQATGLEAGRSLGGKYSRVYMASDEPHLEPRGDTAPRDVWKVDTQGLALRPDPEHPSEWAISEHDITPDRLELRSTTHPDKPVPKSLRLVKYSPDEPRDERGRWTDGGGGSGGTDTTGRYPTGSGEAPRVGMGDITITPRMASDLAGSTAAPYLTADGHFTADRQALHDRIVSNALAGSTPVENPHMVMMGGGPASGKTAMVDSGAVRLPDNAVSINPDDIKNQIPEVQAMQAAGETNWAALSHEESAYVGARVQAAAYETSRNVISDTTGDSSIDKLSGKIDARRCRRGRGEARRRAQRGLHRRRELHHRQPGLGCRAGQRTSRFYRSCGAGTDTPRYLQRDLDSVPASRRQVRHGPTVRQQRSSRVDPDPDRLERDGRDVHSHGPGGVQPVFELRHTRRESVASAPREIQS